MAKKNYLSKQSSETDLKRYFSALQELNKSKKEFPVNLDEVWMLVYGRKADAVEALTNNEQFIQDVDYQVLRQNPQNPKGGRPTDNYYLSLSCLEYFIVRKVRAVFEVYRQVFHKVTETLPSYQEQDPIRRAELWITEQKERQQLLLEAQAKQQQIEVQSAQIKELNHAVEEMQPKVSYLDLIMNDKRTLTVTQIAQDYGISAKAFNKILESYHVQRKVNGVWIVYAPYLKEGYVTSQTGQKGTHSDGTPFIYQYTAWTYKGRAFLYQQLKKKGILPLIEKA